MVSVVNGVKWGKQRAKEGERERESRVREKGLRGSLVSCRKRSRLEDQNAPSKMMERWHWASLNCQAHLLKCIKPTHKRMKANVKLQHGAAARTMRQSRSQSAAARDREGGRERESGISAGHLAKRLSCRWESEVHNASSCIRSASLPASPSLSFPPSPWVSQEKDNAANRAQAARLGSVFAQITAAKRTLKDMGKSSCYLPLATCGNATLASCSSRGQGQWQIDYPADYEVISRFPWMNRAGGERWQSDWQIGWITEAEDEADALVVAVAVAGATVRLASSRGSLSNRGTN